MKMGNFCSKSDEVLGLEDGSENVKFLFLTPCSLFITGIDY